jgi:hypothetical protein
MHDATPELPAAVRMNQLLFGFEISQALYVIAELDVATELLDGPRDVDSLASATGADSGRVGESHSPAGLPRCISHQGNGGGDHRSRPYAGGWTRRFHARNRTILDADALRAIRQLSAHRPHGETAATDFLGRPFFEWINDSPQLAEVQNTAMADGGRALGGDLLESYQLPEGETVADIGGADGTLLVKLLARQHERRGIVFDLPTVVAKAPATLRAAGLSDRIRVVEGDFFASVPSADVYVMSVVLHDWDDALATRILRNIAAAATPGARLCFVELVVPEDDNLHFATLMDITMLAIVGGRERTETEWRKLLTNGGFTMDRIVAGPAVFSIIEATAN